jgi:hypothetical protein
MKLTGQDLETAIAGAAEGLLFPSESDAPVTAHRIAKAGEKRRKAGTFPPGLCPDGATCSTQSVATFFKPVLEVRDWFGPEEIARTEKFEALLALLRANLTSLRVYRVGETTIDVYVLGRTSDGDLAGIRTKVVET